MYVPVWRAVRIFSIMTATSRGRSIYVLYTDDSILAGPDKAELKQILEDMKASGLQLTIEGDISNLLGVKVKRQPNGMIHMTQPQLMDSILKDLSLHGPNVQTKNTPAKIGVTLTRHHESQPYDGRFDYQSGIGKTNYLEKSTSPEIAYAVHQFARFSADPKVKHGEAIKWLGRYLRGTRDKGLIFKPTDQWFDCWVNADRAGNWDPTDSNHPDTARSRTGYVIRYAGCPIT